MRTCEIPGCERRLVARGFCESHYRKWKRHGDPLHEQLTWRELFWTHVEVTGFCWDWTAHKDRDGYGKSGRRSAHRAAYELLVEPIPNGMTVDHLCRNRSCVNPDHLEPVPPAVNTLRGFNVPATNARKTHCVNGHEFTPENTYYSPSRPRQRRCLACNRVLCREYYARKVTQNGATP